MHGGRFATMAPQILEARQAAMDLTYQQMEDDFKEKHGLKQILPYLLKIVLLEKHLSYI